MIELNINGRMQSVDAAPDTPLLYVLRDHLAMNGAKFGCGLGQCGACTVMVDGDAVFSCLTPISVLAGRRIKTVEGLGTIENPGPLQRAFIDEQAAQCGYCIAGMMMRESEFSHRAADESLPLRDAFSVLFFVSVGMLFDPAILVRQPFQVLAVVAIIVFGKSLTALAIVLGFRRPAHVASTVAAGLAQIGEFSFILAGLGVSLGLVFVPCAGPVLAGHAGEGGGQVRARGGDAHRHRHAAAHLLHDGLHHAAALLVGETMGLARDAEDGEAGDAGGERALDEARQALGVEGAVVAERGGEDVEDAGPAYQP